MDDAQPAPEIPTNGKDTTEPVAPPVDAKPPEPPRPYIAFKFLGLGSADYELSRSVDMPSPQQWSAAADHCRTMADLMLRQVIIQNLQAEAEEAQRKAVAVAPPGVIQRVRDRMRPNFRHGGRPRG